MRTARLPSWPSGFSLALRVDDAGLDAGERPAHGAGAYVHAGVVGDHDAAGLRLPPVVVERHADSLDAPLDGLRVEGLADGCGEAEVGEVERSGKLRAGLHEHADGRRGGVPDGDHVVLQYLVPLARAEPAFVDDLGDAVRPTGPTCRRTCR